MRVFFFKDARMQIDFGSVASGIEAASVAFEPLGWKAAWFAEIEPFPCAVLAHHYPAVPNLGDMKAVSRRVLTGEIPAPAVLCGGTPCQAFSVAGLRESLADERGNLTLKFVEIADAIDHVRTGRGEDECIVLWENVPGVLNTKDNAFGCFLAGLAGEDGALEPPGGKWANAGAVYGPSRAVAWRTLDAQYFGMAQRRRRVFVVASARKDFDPTQVLFEWDGVRRDIAPSRKPGKDIAGSLTASAGRRGGVSEPERGQLVEAFGGNNQSGPIDVATARNACASASGRMDFETETFLVQPTHTLRGEGFDASEDGTGRGTPLVPVGVTIHGTDPTVQKVASLDETAQCLRARTPGNIDNSSTTVVMQPVSFAIQAGALRTNPLSGPDGIGVQADHAYTLEARAEVQAVAVALRGREGGATAELGDEVQNCLRASNGGGDKPHVLTAMQVRRLTPTEAERLMGFPDGYTAIPWRGKPPEQCPDGPRYRALGNSWAVPVATWIGQRIDTALHHGQTQEPRGAEVRTRKAPANDEQPRVGPES
jgi:DNA (cytosine-5)-methyltransferase 1